MRRLEEFIESCHTPAGKFQFRELAELEAFVVEQGRILYPVSLLYSDGYFNLEYLIDDPEDKEIADIIRDSDFQFQQITEQFLQQVCSNDILKQFLTETGDDQFFYYDTQKEKLFLASHMWADAQ